ncbi:MAG TPA: arginine--tRNA ligase [Candidatus Paceibacterota bacterium]|nr:arginine--tRNA ligase [Candidatus Paceibacterota bacterium]
MQGKIHKAVADALKSLGAGEAAFVVERPRSMEHGDYATNAALVAKVDAQTLADKLKIDGVEKVEVVGKFINFYLSRQELVPKEQNIPQLYAGKKVMVEYTDPNPFKEFHIGHLMSNTIGEAIARLFETSGADTVRANYQGDVGAHVAKAIWGKQQKLDALWGEAYVYGSDQYEAHKDEIDTLNKTIYEKSDVAVNTLYDEGRAQ